MSARTWFYVMILIMGNTFLYFSLLPAFKDTSLQLNETLRDGITAQKPGEIFDKIIGRGISGEDLTLLYYLGDIVAIAWGFMKSQEEETISGMYHR